MRYNRGVDRTVELVDVPVALHLRTFERIDALRRELALIAAEPDAGGIPARVVGLAAEFEELAGELVAGDGDTLRAARAAGRTTVDLTYRIPAGLAPTLADVLRRIATLLQEVDEHCRRDGELLTTPAAPDERAYGDWVFTEPARQLAGAGPAPWAGGAPAR